MIGARVNTCKFIYVHTFTQQDFKNLRGVYFYRCIPTEFADYENLSKPKKKLPKNSFILIKGKRDFIIKFLLLYQDKTNKNAAGDRGWSSHGFIVRKLLCIIWITDSKYYMCFDKAVWCACIYFHCVLSCLMSTEILLNINNLLQLIL